MYKRQLLARVAEALFPDDRVVELLVPFSAIGTLHAQTTPERVDTLEHTGEGIHIRVRLSAHELQELMAAGAAFSASAASPDGRP